MTRLEGQNVVRWRGRAKLEEAARVMGVVQGVRDRLNMVVPPYEDRTFIVEGVGLSRLDDERRAELFAEGRAMTPDDGIDWILETITGWGFAPQHSPVGQPPTHPLGLTEGREGAARRA